MIICPFCNTANREGMFFCEECGSPLIGKDIKITRATPTQLIKPKTEELAAQKTATTPPTAWAGTTLLRTDSTILVHIEEKNESIHLQPQAEIVIGRADEKTQSYPDLDLTPHGALEKGVSRIHAAIRRSDDSLTLTDLDSANGTFLNGQQLLPQKPHILRDGDEMRFGKLVSRIYFK